MYISMRFTGFPAIDFNSKGTIGIDSAAPTRLLTFPGANRPHKDRKAI